ncbi:MAG: Oxygen-sensitive ribonucleoside-triphosphate reductase [uncultured bacterium]|nr:MAG: Oxygen-sensitive ribonucleoside-triphosphate reductase [uncultured bacterium]
MLINIYRKNMEKYICHDCGKTLESNEEYMPYKVGEAVYVKCKTCHQKDSVLRNFQTTEVYSRVVGYIRPVQQWNKGKRTEFRDRVEFVVEQPACNAC